MNVTKMTVEELIYTCETFWREKVTGDESREEVNVLTAQYEAAMFELSNRGYELVQWGRYMYQVRWRKIDKNAHNEIGGENDTQDIEYDDPDYYGEDYPDEGEIADNYSQWLEEHYEMFGYPDEED